MKIVIFTGDHIRHLYYANQINKIFKVSCLIIEKREAQNPDLSKIKYSLDRKLAKKHFNNRDYYENYYFKSQNTSKFSSIKYVNNIEKKESLCIKIINEIEPDLVLLFGVSIIKGKLYNKLPKLKINLHSGLLPYFKGSAGNFWPFYFLKPNWSGYTFHIVDQKVDSGSIIHHSLPKLSKNDTIHQVSCKALIKASKDILKILSYIKKNNDIPTKYINNQGKFFSTKDFKFHHLRIIYNFYNDDIVNHYLNKKIKQKAPKIIKLF